MDLPFKLTFFQYSKSKTVEKYVDSLSELYRMETENIIEITENLDTYLSFSGVEDVRLYMDGLELLPEEFVGEDENGNVFLEPSDLKHAIYENVGNNSYFPLIPGYYQICVISSGKKYFSLFRIRTKQVTEEQWEVMKNDVEKSLSGLAQDLVKKNSNVKDNYNDDTLPSNILRKWHLINQFKIKLMSSIQDLTTNPRQNVKKNYLIVPISQARKTDDETVKFLSQHPEKKDFYKTPYREVNLNLPENKLIKAVLKEIDKTLKEIYSHCIYYEDITNRKINTEKRNSFGVHNGKLRSLEVTLEEIKSIKTDSSKLITNIQHFLNNTWLKDVPSVKNINIPNSVTMDQRYQIIFKLYKKLKNDRFTITFDPIYQYNWKRTDLLYEIWSFIKVIEAFTSDEIGFSPVSGWLIDDYPHVPELLPKDKILMKKEDITIQIMYEGEVLGESKDTTLEHPLYTGTENRTPDCRIDYYDSKGYIGSLVLDFKYRPVKYIWSDSLVKNRGTNKVMRQLNNYKNSFKSKWFYRDRLDSLLFNQLTPIREVWGVYPLQKNEKTIRYLNDHYIRLMDLTPNEESEHFTKMLKELTNQIIELSKRF
ncbi:DUF2357 domain-containing protein [Ureibacillus endophyticus]|uniref:DUF2357 domain-containing protein n=1 Tax=Ureibacillus endophyticus TaxID=1978490 RepID=A0A494YSK4_9BACL|nr:DUF2357 domain-containing protein [Lysinibacillus endophyticus]RKQ12772.1 DUF2357 domain-containing protein [Lysinibacillus endophyticus]